MAGGIGWVPCRPSIRATSADLRARCRTDHLPELRLLPSSWRGWTVPTAHLSQDVKKHAPEIADVTELVVSMPASVSRGWLPRRSRTKRRLTDAQIKLIADWVSQGAPEGNASETPELPKFTEGWQLGAPDLILEAQSAYSSPASGPGRLLEFRDSGKPRKPCATFVRVEIRPGDKRIVHHAKLYVDRARSARRQETAEGQGFPGMDVVIDPALSEPDDGHFLFWKPGGAPYVEPDGFAWRLDPGNDLVLNAHLRPSDRQASNRCGPPSVFTLPTSHRKSSPCWSSSSMTARSTSRQGTPISWSPTIFAFLMDARRPGRLSTRALSGTRARRLRDPAQRPAQMVDPNSRLGSELAGSVPL